MANLPIKFNVKNQLINNSITYIIYKATRFAMFKFLILAVVMFVAVEGASEYKKRVLRMAENMEGEFENLNNMEEFEDNEARVMQMKENK